MQRARLCVEGAWWRADALDDCIGRLSDSKQWRARKLVSSTALGLSSSGVERLVRSHLVPTPAHLALTPEIDEFRRQFEQLADDADVLVSTLTDEQFAWQPASAKSGRAAARQTALIGQTASRSAPGGEPAYAWSIAQCIDHLNVTARLYLPMLDEGIANAIRQGLYGEGPFTYWWLARLFVRMLEPPPRFRTTAPAAFQPPPARTRREIMAAFRAYQVQYVDRLRQANGLDLARARVRSVAASWIYMPLGTGFAVMTAHERRHLWQARKVMDAPGFPG